MKKLSLVIPCYNESKNLEPLASRCHEVFGEREDVEVILVDNGSTDDSAKVLAEISQKYAGIRSVKVEVNQGYGFGILSGLRAADGEYIGWTHADMQTDPHDALRALELLAERDYPEDVYVKGRRYGRPIGDTFFTIGMSFFETIVLRRFLWDINAQPNIFPKSFFDSWENPPSDFSLDLFAYYTAKKSGLKVIRFPVYFGDRLHGTSHWNVDWKAKVKFIKRTMDFTFKLRRELFSAGV